METSERLLVRELAKISEGNIGAASVIGRILETYEGYDPKCVLPAAFVLIAFSENTGIRGSSLWVLFKDYCGESALNLAIMMRATQLGLIDPKPFAVRPTVPYLRPKPPDFSELLKQIRGKIDVFAPGVNDGN